jgi:hypothetical protein
MAGILSDDPGGKQQGRVGFRAVKRPSWARFVAPLALAALTPTLLAVATACKGKAGSSGAAPSVAAPVAAAPAPKTVRLVLLPAAIGEKRKAERKGALTLSVEFWQENEKLGTNESSRNEEYERTSEVLGLVGGAPAKEKVHYERYRLHEAAADKPALDDSSVEGKTYLLDATDGKLRAEGEGGKSVSAAEMDRLRKLHAELGKEDPIVAAIGGAPITVGKPLTMREELLRALVTTEAGELKSGRIWLDDLRTEAGRDIAVFKWTADTQSKESNGLSVAWHMSGSVTVGVSPATTLATTLTGSMDVSGESMQRGARVTLAGAGTVKDESSLTVSRP